MKGINVRIISNLQGRVHAVNSTTALSGIEPFVDGLGALKSMVDNGTVEVSKVNGMPLYLLGFDARMNPPTLTRVK